MSALWEEILIGRLRLPDLPKWVALRLMTPPVKRILARRMWNTALVTDKQDLNRFIGLSDDDKDRFRRTIEALEPDADLRRYDDDLVWLLESGVFICNVLAGLVLAVRSCRRFEDTKPLVQELAQWLSGGLGGDGQGLLALLLSFTVLLHDTPPEWVSLLEDLTRRLVDTHPELLFGEPRLPLAGFKAALLPLGLAYGKRGTGMPLLETLLRDSAAVPERLARLLEELAPIGLYYPTELFGTLRCALPSLRDGHGVPDQVRTSLIESLGTIRALHVDKVDAFLAGVDPLLPLLPMAYHDKLKAIPRYLFSIGVYNNAVHMALHYPNSRRRLLMDGMRALAGARREASFRNQVARNFVRALQEVDYKMERWTTHE